MKDNQSTRGHIPGSGHLSHKRPWTMLRIFQWLGIALGAGGCRGGGARLDW